MTIRKSPLDNQFTQIPNSTCRDSSLSVWAHSVLIHMLSLPADWEIHPMQIAEEKKIGRTKIYKCMEELKNAGYLKAVQCRKKGKFSNVDYELFYTPQPTIKKPKPVDTKEVEPCDVLRDTVKRDTVNEQTTNKDNTNTYKTNICNESKFKRKRAKNPFENSNPPDVENPIRTHEEFEQRVQEIFCQLRHAWIYVEFPSYKGLGASQSFAERKLMQYTEFLVKQGLLASSATQEGYLEWLEGGMKWQFKSQEDRDVATDDFNARTKLL